MPENAPMPGHAAEAISARLAELLSPYTLQEVVRMLADVGFATSVQTVWRYQEGLAQRIDSAFLAGVAEAMGANASWLLFGPTDSAEEEDRRNRRSARALRGVAIDAAASYFGSPTLPERVEKKRRRRIAEFVADLLLAAGLEGEDGQQVLKAAATPFTFERLS